jgi:hypothetical protein
VAALPAHRPTTALARGAPALALKQRGPSPGLSTIPTSPRAASLDYDVQVKGLSETAPVLRRLARDAVTVEAQRHLVDLILEFGSSQLGCSDLSERRQAGSRGKSPTNGESHRALLS